MKKFINILGVATVALTLTSCLKDKPVNSLEYGMINYDKQKIIELPSPPSHLLSIALDYVDKVIEVELVTVGIAADQPLSENLQVVLDTTGTTAAIDDYNTANGTQIIKFPDNLYTYISPGLNVTMPSGSRLVSVKANVNAINFDPSATYALQYTIKSVDKSGYTISGNFGKVMVFIGAKNKYDGVYNVSGTFQDVTNTAFGYYGDYKVDLVTISSNACRVDNQLLGFPGYVFTNGGSPTYYGNFGLIIRFDPSTGKVIKLDNYYGTPPDYISSNGRSAELDPSGGNQYVFGTSRGIQNIKYWMNQPAAATPHRSFFSEKWEYAGPR